MCMGDGRASTPGRMPTARAFFRDTISPSGTASPDARQSDQRDPLQTRNGSLAVRGRRWRPGKALLRALLRPPYLDEVGSKGVFERVSRAQPHVVRKLHLSVAGWPRTTRPIRIAFLSDLHAGSHANDVVRLRAIIDEVADYKPDLALHGGDFVNMQPFGGGRLAPEKIASILSYLKAPLGNFAVLGNHDHCYGADEITEALTSYGIKVLDDEAVRISFEGHIIDLIGLPDARYLSEAGRQLIGGTHQTAHHCACT